MTIISLLLRPVLAGVLQVFLLFLPSLCKAQPPTADIKTQTILAPGALSFQMQQEQPASGLSSWFSENLTVHGKRRQRDLQLSDYPFLKQYDDGHAAGDITLWKGMKVHMQFGEDTKHDSVTGSYIAPFGEAYRLSNPLKQR